MSSYSESFSTFTVVLGQSAHQIAEQFCHPHLDWQKAEQVYLNTLSVYAVDYYLKCLGYSTDWENCDSHNIAAQILMDVADLLVKDYGKLECRRVLPGEATVYIPAEVWHDRLGYVAVALDEELEQAEILGFFQQIDTVEVPLSQLRPLERLPDYLSSHHQVKPLSVPKPRVHLSDWFKNIFTMGWHSVEESLRTEPVELALQFRASPNQALEDDLSTSVTRTKIIKLGQPEQSVLVIMTLKLASPQALTNIQIELLPTGEQRFLPVGLQLSILDEYEETVMESKAQEAHDGIRFELNADANSYFSMKISLSDVAIIEDFLV